MASVYYHTVGGKVRGETGATRRDYLTDALGSVTGTVDQASQVENVYRYKPYGGTLYKTGSAEDPRLRWTGDTGSRTTGDRYAGQYNRARHYGTQQGQWTAVDPLWPEEPAYGYVGGNPATWVDPSGLKVRICSGPLVWGIALPGGPLKSTSHWFIETDIPGCRSIGYGPSYGRREGGVRLDDSWFNSNGGHPVDCQELNASPEQEKCVCEIARNAAKGWTMCGTQWNDPKQCPDYNFVTHNCQDFVLGLLTGKCGIGIPWGYQRGTVTIGPFPIKR